MTMEVTLKTSTGGFRFFAPPEGQRFAEGQEWRCEKCGSVRVRGLGLKRRTHDTYIADAVCDECLRPAGELHARMRTIFGLDEDDAVLVDSRCRVYPERSGRVVA